MKGAKVRHFYYFCAKLDKENMGKKKKFRFNPETLNYEQIEHTFGYKLKRFLMYILTGVFSGVIFFFAFMHFVKSPREKQLMRENQNILSQYTLLNKQLDEEGELSFGMVGIFKLSGRNLVFVPRRASAYEFYGMAPFTMRPLNALQAEPRRSRAAASWFAANRTYLKIAASILVLLVLSFVLSTPISVKDGNQEYASMNAFKVSTDGAFPYVAEVHELAIAMPRPDADSVVVKGYGSQRRGEAAAERTIDDKYFLIVCSVLSQSEADKFIAAQTTTGYDFRVLARNGKYRVYVASGKSVPELMELKYAIADDYPDAWVHYSK